MYSTSPPHPHLPPAHPHPRPWEVHASQGLKVGLYTPPILGGNSYLSWFYDRGTIKDRAHTGTSKGLSQVINSGPIRKFQPKYANVYVTIQSHGLSAGVRTHYVTINGVRDGLTLTPPPTPSHPACLIQTERRPSMCDQPQTVADTMPSPPRSPAAGPHGHRHQVGTPNTLTP